jgi:hypothetical protein
MLKMYPVDLSHYNPHLYTHWVVEVELHGEVQKTDWRQFVGRLNV